MMVAYIPGYSMNNCIYDQSSFPHTKKVGQTKEQASHQPCTTHHATHYRNGSQPTPLLPPFLLLSAGHSLVHELLLKDCNDNMVCCKSNCPFWVAWPFQHLIQSSCIPKVTESIESDGNLFLDRHLFVWWKVRKDWIIDYGTDKAIKCVGADVKLLSEVVRCFCLQDVEDMRHCS